MNLHDRRSPSQGNLSPAWAFFEASFCLSTIPVFGPNTRLQQHTRNPRMAPSWWGTPLYYACIRPKESRQNFPAPPRIWSTQSSWLTSHPNLVNHAFLLKPSPSMRMYGVPCVPGACRRIEPFAAPHAPQPSPFRTQPPTHPTAPEPRSRAIQCNVPCVDPDTGLAAASAASPRNSSATATSQPCRTHE